MRSEATAHPSRKPSPERDLCVAAAGSSVRGAPASGHISRRTASGEAPVFIITAEFGTFEGWPPATIADAIRDPFAALGIVVLLRPETKDGGGLYDGASYDFSMRPRIGTAIGDPRCTDPRLTGARRGRSPVNACQCCRRRPAHCAPLRGGRVQLLIRRDGQKQPRGRC